MLIQEDGCLFKLWMDDLGDEWHVFINPSQIHYTGISSQPRVATHYRIVRLPQNQKVFDNLSRWANYAGTL